MSQDNQTPMSVEETRTRHALPFTPELIEKVRKHISELCQSKFGGWRMCVPVDRDDSDMLFGGLCDSHEMLRAQLVALQNPERDRKLIEAAMRHGELRVYAEYDGIEYKCPSVAAIIKKVDGGEGE